MKQHPQTALPLLTDIQDDCNNKFTTVNDKHTPVDDKLLIEDWNPSGEEDAYKLLQDVMQEKCMCIPPISVYNFTSDDPILNINHITR